MTVQNREICMIFRIRVGNTDADDRQRPATLTTVQSLME